MAVVDIAEIVGVTPPAIGGTPVTETTPNLQYTGAVVWSPDDVLFKRHNAYLATITLTAEDGFDFTGVSENFFTVEGALSTTNTADSGVVTAIFPMLDLTKITGNQALAYVATLSPVIQARLALLSVQRGVEILANDNLLHTAELELLMEAI